MRSGIDRAALEPVRSLPGRTCATVFGLDVRTDRDVPFLQGTSVAATGRTLDLSVLDAREPPAEEWPVGAELLCDQRDASGAVGFQIESDPRAGYRIWGPTHGAHLLSRDGRRLTSFTGDRRADMGWQRLLIAQALPFAAALRGLEVFHAGAVLLDGAAIAFAGPSGSGKSSTVVELCRGGASFIADDVLALEHANDELFAHPGTPLAGIGRSPTRGEGKQPPSLDMPPASVEERVEHAGGERPRPQEIVAADTRELMVRMSSAERASPLHALFFLDRRADGPDSPRFEPLQDAQALLTATFNFVLASPDRLRRLLDVCALLAARRVERIVFGGAANPAVVVAAVRARLSGGE